MFKPFTHPWLKAFYQSIFGAAFLGVAFTALCGLLFAKLTTSVFDTYGWTLFLGLPFFCGFTSVFIYSLPKERTAGSFFGVSALSIVLLGILITAFAIDGLICILMAAPLAFVVAIPGAALGHFLAAKFRGKKNSVSPIVSLILVMPLLMGFEAKLGLKPPLRQVITSIDIDASPENVWKSVVVFPPIPEPQELVFKAGIAYPQNATIKGRGVGAVRYCNFSTGPFVEPIQIWDEPHLLRFSVSHNPSPLKELSLYSNLQPAHLENFMISKQGQFKLIRLNATKTRLEGTTWYYHRLWPSAYWGVISDAIIHKIHGRVLNHIKVQAEKS